MEKYYTVTPGSQIHNEYLEYIAMSDKVNTAFKEFAQEQGIETTEYFPITENLCICNPTKNDKEKFGSCFKKDQPGFFKKYSVPAKTWTAICKSLNLKSPRKPCLPFYFNAYGRTSCRLFMINDVLYASFQSEYNFKNPDGFEEMKASEFFKIIEDYQESVDNK